MRHCQFEVDEALYIIYSNNVRAICVRGARRAYTVLQTTHGDAAVADGFNPAPVGLLSVGVHQTNLRQQHVVQIHTAGCGHVRGSRFGRDGDVVDIQYMLTHAPLGLQVIGVQIVILCCSQGRRESKFIVVVLDTAYQRVEGGRVICLAHDRYLHLRVFYAIEVFPRILEAIGRCIRLQRNGEGQRIHDVYVPVPYLHTHRTLAGRSDSGSQCAAVGRTTYAA